MDAPRPETTKTVGLLLSGGLDSAILLKVLLDRGNRVQPFYIDFGQYWQADELRGVESFLAAISTPNVLPLVTLDLPLADIYEDHWSITGRTFHRARLPMTVCICPVTIRC